MNNKRGLAVLFAGLFIFLLLLNSIHAADLSSGLESAKSGLDKAQEGIEKIEDIKTDLETARADYLLEKWKGFFLKIPAIAAVDSFLQKLNIVFVVLFAKGYSFSLGLLFVIILWILTAITLSDGIGSFFSLKEYWQKFLVGIASAVIISWIQLFNLLSNLAVKAIFYPSRWYWSILSFLGIIFAFFVYYQLGVILSAYLKKKKKNEKEQETELRIKKQEVKFKEIEKAIK